MDLVCHIDGTTHPSLEALHAYIWGSYRVGKQSYYHQYHPRRDLLTGELIPFKDAEQYLTADFATKVNLRKWISQQPREVGLAWAKAWLTKRRESKGLVYAPSQAELRTLCCPSMPYYESVAAAEGGYYGVTTALGFKPRYTSAPPVYQTLPADTTVIQDTREQEPVKLPIRTVVSTLEVGDYALATPHDQGVRIERKSLSDFCGTMSGRKQTRTGKTKTTEWCNLERFDRELARATEASLYVVMMVEANINDAQSINHLPQTRWVKASPAYLLHNLRELLVKYPLSFQVVFIDGRKDMAAKMMHVLQIGAAVRTCDLQFALEEGRL